jgi:hypothetical protein
VQSALFAVPIERRRRLAATLGLFAVLFVAVGAVATTGHDNVVLAFAGIAFLVALVLGLAAWGVVHSIRIDAAARHLDDAIGEVMSRGGQTCACGHDHDPSEMHVTDRPACGAPTDAACEHNCDVCEHLLDRAVRPSRPPR